MLDRVHPHRSFADRGRAFDRFQILDRRIDRRLVLQILAPELDAEVDRRRLQFQRHLFAGMQRCAADARGSWREFAGARTRHEGLNNKDSTS